MQPSKQQVAFELTWTVLTDAIDPETHDFLFCDWSDAGVEDPKMLLWKNVILDLPNPIRGYGPEWKLRLQEYPSTISGRNLFSKRFLNTLLEVGRFPHHAYPVRLFYYDHPAFKGRGSRFEVFWDYGAPEEAPEDTYTDDFVLLQLLEYTSTEAAQPFEFKTFYPEDNSSGWAKGLVFPPGTVLPPVFREGEPPFTWWLSEDALEAITQAQIRGVEFYPNRQITEPKPV